MNESKEDFLLDVERQSSSRISTAKKSKSLQDRIENFSLVLEEVFPLIESCMKSGETFEEIKDDLLTLFSRQSRIVDGICGMWGVDQDRILGGPYRSFLGKNLGHLIVDTGQRFSDDQLLDMCTLVDSIIAEHSFVNKMAADAESASADDILVTLRLSSLPQLVRVRDSLDKFCLSRDETDDHMEAIFSGAVSLSRDLAYNYDPAGTIWDRERLFIGALPYCIRFSLSAWEKLCLQSFGEPNLVLNDDVDHLAAKLHRSQEAVEKMDMGYDDRAHSRSNLMRRFAEGIKGIAVSSIQSIDREELFRAFLSYRISVIDEVLADCWVQAGSDLIEFFESLSGEEQDQYLANHSGEPMNLSRFWELVQQRLESDDLLRPSIEVDVSDIIDVAGKQLVSLWGLSDGICKVRKVDNA